MDRRLVVLKCHIFGAVACPPPLAVSALIRDVRISVREAVLPFGTSVFLFERLRSTDQRSESDLLGKKYPNDHPIGACEACLFSSTVARLAGHMAGFMKVCWKDLV
jgi:hypothetical protein